MAIDGKSITKVLLLKNYSSASPSDHLMVQSFQDNIHHSVPDAQLDICCIANGETIPTLTDYRLVILSGGTVNLLEDEKPSWALHVLDMVRRLAASGDETVPKLLGICWGHQAIHYALGGTLAWLEDWPRIGVQDIQLTPDGVEKFQKKSLKLHKFHVRGVSALAPDFLPLADLNEITISRSEKILTIQGHPELTYDISQILLARANTTYQPSKDRPSGVEGVVIHDVSTPHDGQLTWDYIMKWALT